jgi:hypothetical protein
MNAVMTVSHALDSVMREVCPGIFITKLISTNINF